MFEDERAKEIEELRDIDALPSNFGPTNARRNSIGRTNSDIADEIGELLSQGALSKPVASGLLQGLKAKTENGKATNTIHDVVKVTPFEDDGLPSHWSRAVSQHAVYSLIELKKGDREFDEIESDLEAAGIKVLSIERLQNNRHLERFKDEMKDIKSHHSRDFDMNICYLYHGTNGDKERLCEESLDQRLSRMGHYGRGIYFSDNPAKCVQYTKRSEESSTIPYILRCRVILGDTKVYPNGAYDTTLRREPEKENYISGWRYYDSVMGCPVDYNEYVVYESRRAMIEYIITFSVEDSATVGQCDSFTEPHDFSYEYTSADKDLEETSEDCTVAESTFDDDYRTTEVRQAFGRKHREEEFEYQPLSVEDTVFHNWPQEQSQTEHELLLKLQELDFEEPENPVIKESEAYETDDEETGSEDINPSYHDNSSSSFSNTNATPTAQDVNMNISEFMQVTGVEDSRTAKKYLRQANMDVNLAISYYYQDL